MSVVLGLVGKAGAGKDTLAAFLVEDHDFVRVAFADALKQAAVSTDPYVEITGIGGHGKIRLAQYVELVGWDEAKQAPDVRRLLQRLGVAMRDVSPGIWVDIAAQRIAALAAEGRNVVVTDVRFPDEASMISQFASRWFHAPAGIIVRIERPDSADLGSNGSHVSETALDGLAADVTISNGSNLAALRDQAADLALWAATTTVRAEARA